MTTSYPHVLGPAVEDLERSYRPVVLARVVGLSASQVRNYERFGFLPPARRTDSGHRRFGEPHLAALMVARCLQGGYGWQRALDAMQAVHDGDSARAFAVADERHAYVHDQREQVTTAVAALAAAHHQTATVLGLRVHGGRTVSIGQASAALGVNASALRYWESRGLLVAIRAPNGRRRYDRRLLQRIQLIKLLRDIDYGFDTIAAVVDDLTDPAAPRARRALEERRERIELASRATAQATSALVTYIERCEPGSHIT